MRQISSLLPVLCLLLASIFSTQAQAQDVDQAIRGFLDGLFEQAPNAPTQPRNDNRRQSERAENRRVPMSQGDVQMSFAPLVAKTAPAVVNVYAARTIQTRRSPFEGDPFFEQFFGRSQPRQQSSLGSGVIVDRSGLIVTNNHVIEGMDEIKVALSDGREFESRVVLRDERSDLAVLKVESREEFPSLTFGQSDALLTGDLVLAIGNPFGVGQTITSGIVSATARTQIGVSDFGFFIQTDAAINPGNSGGALIDMNGKLIGINTAIYSRSGGSIGIGFAIPVDMVRAVVSQAQGGADAFERPYLGASFEAVTAAMAESLGMRRPSGAIVADISSGSPADAAGLRVGDVVLSINGNRVEHPDALGFRLATLAVGDNVEMDVFSRGQLVNMKLTLVKAPTDIQPEKVLLDGRGPFAGAEVSNLTPSILRQLRLPADTKGVVIADLQRGSNAAQAGFRPGDIIESVNGTTIADVGIMQEVVAKGGRGWSFRLNRGGRVIQQYLRF